MMESGVTVQGKVSFMSGEFKTKDRWMIALYGAGAHLGPDTDFYTPAGEVECKGYKAGGIALRNCRVWRFKRAACMGWDSLTIPNASIRAHGFLIYNASAENKTVFVGDWGGEYASTEGPFTIPIAADTVIFD